MVISNSSLKFDTRVNMRLRNSGCMIKSSPWQLWEFNSICFVTRKKKMICLICYLFPSLQFFVTRVMYFSDRMCACSFISPHIAFVYMEWQLLSFGNLKPVHEHFYSSLSVHKHFCYWTISYGCPLLLSHFCFVISSAYFLSCHIVYTNYN